MISMDMPHVLLVDDDVELVSLLNFYLRSDGFRVSQAHEGETAVRMAFATPAPDIAVIDVMMPGEMDGLQVLDAIKSDPRISDTLVAMVTARGQVADGDDARKRGADAYFIKPFSPLQVVAWVREHAK